MEEVSFLTRLRNFDFDWLSPLIMLLGCIAAAACVHAIVLLLKQEELVKQDIARQKELYLQCVKTNDVLKCYDICSYKECYDFANQSRDTERNKESQPES